MKGWKPIFLAAAAVIITAISAWYIQRPIVTKKADWNDVMAEARTGGYQIITTDELAGRYRKNPSGMLLVDTRQEWEYRIGHMEGALNFSMEPTRWARWKKAGELKDFLGPDKERAIIFY
jgi:predicted sulfurtransferase